MASLRSSARALQQQFSATVSKQHVRHLHMTGAYATPTKLLTTEPSVTQSPLEPKVTEIPHPSRHFNTSRSLKAVNDSSTIDFAYMPQFALEIPQAPEIMRIPLLPDNYVPPRRSVAQQEAVESVIRPQIETASADSSGVVSAMSEVTDNHSMEGQMDMYDLTKQVGKAAMGVVEENVEQVKKHGGVVKELWTGLLDDLLGKKIVKS
ncbi:hypothetical protein MMC19_004971 [Ptychographa xylographoides]|nr:hypothetical protein [Ptychographa xylographoides]